MIEAGGEGAVAITFLGVAGDGDEERFAEARSARRAVASS